MCRLPAPKRQSLHRRRNDVTPRDLRLLALRNRLERAEAHLVAGPEFDRAIVLPGAVDDDPTALDTRVLTHGLSVATPTFTSGIYRLEKLPVRLRL
jgi:hypothetical protein